MARGELQKVLVNPLPDAIAGRRCLQAGRGGMGEALEIPPRTAALAEAARGVKSRQGFRLRRTTSRNTITEYMVDMTEGSCLRGWV